jgi:hypothetical protein
MSNPLIRPNDPRFQRQPITDEAGNNRFADESPVAPAAGDSQPDEASSVFAPPHSSGQTYQPEYVSGQPSRHRLIQWLCASSISAIVLAFAALLLAHWSVYPLLLIAGMISGLTWYTSADELSVIRRGGVADTHRTIARLGVVIGMAGVLLTVGVVYAALWGRVALND